MILCPGGVLARRHSDLSRLALFTDISCHQGEPQDCLIDLTAFRSLTSFTWIGPKAYNLPAIYAAIEANEPHLQHLELDFISMFQMHKQIKETRANDPIRSALDLFTAWTRRLAAKKAAETYSDPNDGRPLQALRSLKLVNIPLSHDAGKILQKMSLRTLVLQQCDGWQRFLRGVMDSPLRPFHQLTTLEIQQTEVFPDPPYEEILCKFLTTVNRIRNLYLWLPYDNGLDPEIWACIGGHHEALESLSLHLRVRKSREYYTMDTFMDDEWMETISHHPELNQLGYCRLKTFAASVTPFHMVATVTASQPDHN